MLLAGCAESVVVAFEGRVQTVEGAPSAAWVTVLGPEGLILAEGEADEAGVYAVEVASPPQALTLVAEQEGLRGFSVVCPSSERLPTVFVGDRSPVLVEGSLVDLEGAPAGLEEVLLRRGWNGQGPVVVSVGTGLDGLFTVELEAGPWTAEVGGARFPVLAGGPSPVGIVAEAEEDSLVVASTSEGLHLVGPVPSNLTAFHVWEDSPAFPSEDAPTVRWSSVAGVEAILVSDRRPGVYRVGLHDAAPGAVVQLISGSGGSFAQAALDAQGVWSALLLDEAVEHPEAYAADADPADTEVW